MSYHQYRAPLPRQPRLPPLASTMRRWTWWLLVSLLVVGCLPVEQSSAPKGADTPAAAVAGFFATLNEALEDPTLDQFDTRRRYAEQMAAHFTPSERVMYRQSLQEMLAIFAEGKADLPPDQELTVTLEYDDLDVQPISEREAHVRLIGGSLRYRIVAVAPNGFREVLLDQQHTLTEVLGLESSVLPTLALEDRWYLTTLTSTR